MKFLLFSAILIFCFENLKSDVLYDDIFDHKCATSRFFTQHNDMKLQGLEPQIQGRRDLQHSYISPSGIFKIYYDTEGADAVDNTDLNQNGIPDYVDSVAYYFDYIYDIMINQMGYYSPYPDGNGGGSDHYDVYLIDTGNGYDTYYGYTSFEKAIFPQTSVFPKYYSYIVMDNDFSPNDRRINDDGTTSRSFATTGIMGMKVTAAHEFYHAIQMMYGIPHIRMFSMNEMASVYMENKIFPESHDYLQYVRSLFRDFNKMPFGYGDAYNGYAFGIYYHFIDSRFGHETIKRQWELIEIGLNQYEAMDSALIEKGTSMAKSWNDFLSWIYHSGSRTIEGYSFYQAELFPEINFSTTGEIYPDGNFELTGSLLPMEIRPIRYYVKRNLINHTSDTLDFLISNLEMDHVFMQSMQLANFKLVYPSPGGKMMCDHPYNIQSFSNISDTAFCRQGHLTLAVDNAFPMPFKMAQDEFLYLPAPKDMLYASKVFVQVFSSDMAELWSNEETVTLKSTKRVAAIDPKTMNLGSGIYLYRITYGDKSNFGKFMIIN